MLSLRFKFLLSSIYRTIHKHTSTNLAANNCASIVKLPEEVISKEPIQKIGRKTLVVKLQELLGIKSSLALEIIMQNTKLGQVPESIIDRNYNLCKNEQISNDTLLKYPPILYADRIKQKLTVLKSLKRDFNDIAPLLLLSHKTLDNFFTEHGVVGVEERIKYFCDKFNITPATAYEAMAKKQFLRSIQIKTVEKNTKLLNDRGITLEDIVRDFWVLRYSRKSITNRFNRAEDEDVEKLKTWMVRGKEEIFEAYIKRKSENRLILGNNSLAEYLMQRLNCSFNEAATMIERFPAIRNKSMRKLREIIDFLYGEGFTAQHIIRLPKILLHSVATSRKRLRELEDLPGGHKLDSVHILTKSQRQYMQYYESTKEKADKLANSAKTESVIKTRTRRKGSKTIYANKLA